MKVCVAGLGLIGGSMCMALKRAGYNVDGWNRSPSPLEYAVENGIIDGAACSFAFYDVVFVALPPEAIINFIDGNEFKDGGIVADICGVKKFIEDKVYSSKRNFRYVGCHPMAGKEVSGIRNACADLFDRASMVITSDGRTDKDALETVRKLTRDMGFKYIVECSAKIHDEKIAYTSQLAHLVSNAYVRDERLESCIGFTGGSFQDMTRIAGVDEYVWASLYLKNAENLSDCLQNLINSLSLIKAAIDCGDCERLRSVLREGKERFESDKKIMQSEDIIVTKLK
ncbi:MAG TPA: prephenate dehydrogenase/arogenate dehydrogenase family protein [Clostridiales bacterium]|nr:prephenate dehydrogenase/arogenate dehydrogenase family protein [Clostridiales bacterium]